MTTLHFPTQLRTPGRTILVVEDDPLVRGMLCLALRRMGHTIFAACDGLEAVEILEEEIHSLDLLLTDISLPGLRGPQVAERALALRPELKVAFASGTILPEERPEPLNRLPFLPKPFTVEELRVFIERCFATPSLMRLLPGATASVGN
jgi:CheY-like chemotaxis protein